jgi:hypothetical protein
VSVVSLKATIKFLLLVHQLGGSVYTLSFKQSPKRNRTVDLGRKLWRRLFSAKISRENIRDKMTAKILIEGIQNFIQYTVCHMLEDHYLQLKTRVLEKGKYSSRTSRYRSDISVPAKRIETIFPKAKTEHCTLHFCASINVVACTLSYN